MNNQKKPLGVAMAEDFAEEENRNDIIDYEDNQISEFKQLLSKISKSLEDSNYIEVLKNDEEVHSYLKNLIIKAVTILD